MGLSLRNIGKKIEQVAIGAYHDINLLDNGKSHGNPTGAPRPSAPPPVVANRPVLTPRPAVFGTPPASGVQLGNLNVNKTPLPPRDNSRPDPVAGFLNKHITQPVTNLTTQLTHSIPVEAAKLGAAKITGNQQAAQNATQGLHQAVKDLAPPPQYLTDKQGKVIKKNGAPVRNPARNSYLQSMAMGTEGGLAAVPEEGAAKAAAKAGVTPKSAPKPVTLTSFEEKAGSALGLKKKDMVAAKQNNALHTAFKTATSKLSPEELANFKPGDQMAINRAVTPKTAPKNLPKANLNYNPFKSNVEPVQPGDYGRARVVPQSYSSPIGFVRDRWTAAMKDLQKTNPNEFSSFWRNVESIPKKASPQLKKAINLWREGSNRTHAATVALGNNTNYLRDWAIHPWMLKDATEQQVATGGIGTLGQHSMGRVHRTIKEGEAHGLQLGDNPLEEGTKYFNGAASAIHRQAAVKSLAEADSLELDKPFTLDLGYGKVVPLSAKGAHEAKGLQVMTPSENKVIKGVRTGNLAAKSSILSAGQFHPFNISVLRAGPSIAMPKIERLASGDLTMGSHPVRAAVGIGRTFRPLLPGGKAATEKMLSQALKEGITDPGTGKFVSYVDAAAQIGAPYGQAGYNAGGTFLKGGIGHKLVFERQMPAMHDQVIRSVVGDLVKDGVPLNSEAARQAGIAANSTMGFINKEALNLSPKVRQAMSDWMLAGQFTPSKIATVSKVGKRGVAGQYARADVASNVIAATAIITGVGALLHQKSDNIRDMLLRAIVNPAVPSSMKDKKGNNIELRTPLTYTGEISKLAGIKLVRGKDGHLGVNWKPGNMPETVSDWAKARLAPVPSAAIKLKTNTDFSNKPLYDPNAPLPQQAEQAATTITQGLMPIGLQGLPYLDAVKKHAPPAVKEVLDANTPGSNPVIKSGLSSIGFSPRTDQTVGQAAQVSNYFSAAADAKKGLNRQERDALDLYTGSKKNPVTGKYDIKPTPNDQRTRATALLQNPKVVDRIIAMNKSLQGKGAKVDPLWNQSKDNVVKYLQYQAMPPDGPDQADWRNKNKWYEPLQQQRSKFFDALPKGDPNKPKAPIEFPSPSDSVQKAQDQYFKLSDSTQRVQFMKVHPELQTQFDKQADYYDKLRKAQGYAAFKGYPKATKDLQSFIDQYTAADKGTRKGLRNANAQRYQDMVAYFDSTDLYNVGKDAAVSALQGEPDYTSKELKAMQSLSRDIYKNADGTYSVVPAGWMVGLSGGGGSSSGGGRRRSYAVNPNKYAISTKTSGARRRKTPYHPSVSYKKVGSALKNKGKPKISMKVTKSKV